MREPKLLSFDEWFEANPGMLELFPEEDCLECDGEGSTECDECGHERECEECNGEGTFGGMEALKLEYKKQCVRDKNRWAIYLFEVHNVPLPKDLAERLEKERVQREKDYPKTGVRT